MNIILASQSPSRKKLLKQAGIEFSSFSPSIDEKSYIKNLHEPQKTCLEIAKAKALKALEKYKKHTIIASDQMAYLDACFYGKSGTKQRAIESLTQLQGQTHQLITSLYMTSENKIFEHVSVSQMTMRSLSLKQIKNYVERDKPLHCAGSYHIEETGISLFTKIETEDFNSIIGLPLIATINQLTKWGLLLLE